MPISDAYVVADLDTNEIPDILHQEAEPYQFPLTEAEKAEIKALEARYDAEENCAGLAGPQVNLPRQVIIFEVPMKEEYKKHRPDLIQGIEKTLWLNPSYEPLTDETHEDYEACFSVKDRVGYVKRYKKIKYKAYDVAGTLIEGEAEGFMARVIQHEIDHVHGILYSTLVEEGKLFTMEAFRKHLAEQRKLTDEEEAA